MIIAILIAIMSVMLIVPHAFLGTNLLAFAGDIILTLLIAVFFI